MPTTLVNIRTNPNYDVRIDRQSKWGNPFRITVKATREQVIEQYREYIKTRPDLLSSIDELRDKRLGCWCSPLPCHGDVLMELLDERT